MLTADEQYTLPDELFVSLQNVQQFDEIDSTNAEAMRQLQLGNTGTSLLLANTQTAGKGRRGRPWYSAQGAGIYLTLVRPFEKDAAALQSLSLIAALSVRSALKEYGINSVQLKWPNDLLVNGQKLAGILLEFKSVKGQNHIAFGVGINLALPENIVEKIGQPAIALDSLVETAVDRSRMVTFVIKTLMDNLQTFEETGFESFQDEWNRLDCYYDKEVVLQLGDKKRLGKSQGVDSNGALRLLTAKGVEIISGGEILPSLRAVEPGNDL